MRIATDIGGTFTDLVAVGAAGTIIVEKAHTTPPDFEQGVLDVIAKSKLDPKSIEAFYHGTTTVINALTERKGAKTALITTKGFRDVLEIARCNRPDLFNLVFAKPPPFIPRYLRYEVSERLNYKGEILTPLNVKDLDSIITELKKEQVEAIAICYLHSYANDCHEKETLAYIKKQWPEVFVTCSTNITKEWREYERSSTVTLNAYVMPLASSYINKLDKSLQGIALTSPKYIMKSNGGTTSFQNSIISPIDMVESGPVAGVFGAAVLGELLGEKNVIAFDIGGTTAKCSLIDNGKVKISTDYRIERTESYSGYPIISPVVDIVEIGNGGGSIAWIDEGNSLRVGPQSAGAIPGPVAYDNGATQPTTTDASLIIGRLSPKNFDNVVDLDNIRQVIDNCIAKPLNMTIEEAAMSIVRVADANMLNALKLISVRRGYDPRDFAMVAFGGGGPMHSAYLAKELGVKKLIIPKAASVFSAWGMLMTDLRNDYIQTKILRVDTTPIEVINALWQPLVDQATQELIAQGVKLENISLKYEVQMRYVGQEHTVAIDAPSLPWKESTKQDLIRSFHTTHEQFYTFKLETTPTEIVNLHLIAYGKLEKLSLPQIDKQTEPIETALKETRKVYFEDLGFIDTKIYHRDLLKAGAVVVGAAIIEEPSSSTVIDPSQKITVDIYGNLIIEGVNHV